MSGSYEYYSDTPDTVDLQQEAYSSSDGASKRKKRVRVKKNTGKHKCKYCDGGFHHKRDRKAHQERCKTRPHRYPCQYCDQSYNKEDMLKEHEKHKHMECEICHQRGHKTKHCKSQYWTWCDYLIRTIATFVLVTLVVASIVTYAKGVDKKYCNHCSDSEVDTGKKMVTGSYILISIMNILATIGVGYSAYHFKQYTDEFCKLCDRGMNCCGCMFFIPVYFPIYILMCLISVSVTLAYAWPPNDDIVMLGRNADVGILTTFHIQFISSIYLVWTQWMKTPKYNEESDIEMEKV